MSYARKMSQFTVLVLPSAGSRVIGQGSLVSQNGARANDRGSADMTSPSDDCVRHLRQSTNAGVTPDDRVFNPRALFDVTTFTQHWVDYFHARLKRALIGDHGQIVDLRMR